MSLILDALKKMEQDRAARRGGPVNIRPELFKERRLTPRKPWRLAVGAGLILLAAVLTFGIVHTISSDNKPPSPSAEALSPAPERSAASSSASPIPAALQAEMPAAPPTAVVSSQRHVAPVENLAEASGPATGGAFSELKVGGIAWQESRRDRRAVVNGVLAGEGGIIAGARIVEIFPDRVRFTLAGQTMDLSISSAANGR
jgi:general secretion pathway protein B